MPDTISVTISPDAADLVADKGLQQPLQEMLDNVPKRMAAVRAIAVSLEELYDVDRELRIMIDVTRDDPGPEDDPTERNWVRWVVENFPPEIFQHFVLMSNFGPNHAGASIS